MKRSPAISRAVAVMLLFGSVVFIISLFGLPIWWLHQHYDDAIQSLDDQRLRYARVAGNAPLIRDAIVTVREKDARQHYLQATNSTLAGAELQDLVRNAIESSKGRLISLQAQAAKEESGHQRVTVKAQYNAAMVPLLASLHAIENAKPYALIDTLSIRSVQGRIVGKPIGLVTETEVFVQTDVSAYVASETK
jgi:hypothetical protein